MDVIFDYKICRYILLWHEYDILHRLKQHHTSEGTPVNILIAGIPKQTHNYEIALSFCGASFKTSLSPSDAAVCDRLLLPGGGDILPSLFHQADQGSRSVDPVLDHAQLLLLDLFVRTERPVLGICKGLQIINIYFGGDIIQDLPTSQIHRYDRHKQTDQIHQVRNAPGSILHSLYGNTCMVNSAHHQGCGQIGHRLTVTQTAPDGVVEALEHTTKPILGVQWHPERTGFVSFQPRMADGLKLIQHFLTQL